MNSDECNGVGGQKGQNYLMSYIDGLQAIFFTRITYYFTSVAEGKKSEENEGWRYLYDFQFVISEIYFTRKHSATQNCFIIFPFIKEMNPEV